MFYERLSYLCKQNDITVTEVASKHLGVAASAATNWKHGANPRADVVIRAAQYFGVATDYLLGLTDNPVCQAPTSGHELEIQQATALLRSASDTARTAAIAALQAVVEALDAMELQE